MIAFAHMLKDYSVFVPKFSYALDSELVCFDAVVFQGTWKWQYLKVW